MTVSAASSLAELEGEYLRCHAWIPGVDFGVEFEAEFGYHYCKLDAVATHLNRWGTAMGFSNNSSSSPSTEECSEPNIRKAKRHLSALNKAFSRASEDGEDADAAAGDETKLLDPQTQFGRSAEDLKALHSALQLIKKTRKPTSNTAYKTEPVRIYDKEIYDVLVKTVSSQIRQLNALFPSLKKEQASLASDEIRAVKDARPLGILWLKDIVKSDDEYLSEALEAETSSNRTYFQDIVVKESAQGHYGHKFGKGEGAFGTPITYSRIEAGGNSVSHFGNEYGLDNSHPSG